MVLDPGQAFPALPDAPLKDDPFAKQRRYVDSSHIRSYAYEPNSQTLQVEFVNGQVYHHFEVTPGLVAAFDNFKAHGSYGKFYAANVKGQYPYERRPDLEQP